MAEMLYGNFRIELEANLGNQVDRTMPASPAAFTWRWPIPVDPPPALLGRDQELDQIRQAVLQRGPIQFYASCGFGVTTLLRYVAAGRPGVSVSAPYLYLRVGDDPLPDVLHRLVSAAFTSEGTIRPTPSLSAQLLATLQAVVVLDDVRSDPEVISYLVTAMPGCPVVVGSARPLLEDGSAPSHRLSGLPETAGLALLARNLARPVNTNELPAARRLWVAVEGQPLHLRQAAALVRAAEHTFAELAAAAERDPESLDRLAIDALPNPQRRVLAVLALAAGALLPPDLLSAMANVADIREAISDLHAHGLAERHEDRFGLPICKVDTYRPQLLTYVDAGSAAHELIRWLTSRDPADHVSLSVAEAALSLIGFAAKQGDLRTVVALVRVVEPILTLAGRWQVYSHALHQGTQAAQQLGDQVSQAYFAHQQGTLALCQDQLPAALQHLQHALELRRRLGDRPGAERTQHNLEVLQPTEPPTPPTPTRQRPRRRVRADLIMACLVLAVIIGSWIAIGAQTGGGAGGADPPVARLEVTPSSGPAPLQITASASTSKAGNGATITSYDFDFGEGTSTGPQPKATVKHTYKSPATYTVTLTVTNSAGRTDQTTQDIAVTKPRPGDPTAKLRVSPRTGEAPMRITARASTSSAGKGAKITDYDFDFGDGTSTGPQPKATVKHTYKSPATYTVTLTVTNSAGRTHETTQKVEVTEPPASEPTAELQVTPQSGEAPLQITANGSASKAGKGATITSYAFDFGDRTTSGPGADATVEHTYKGPETYTVTLTVTNSAGRTHETTQKVEVTEPQPVGPR
jgi:PKD repeat protein